MCWMIPPGLELTSSCTHALEASAQALGIGPGDEVIVPAYSFPSTANPFLLRGADIRFADCDPATGNITPAEIERCATKRTRAVVCMHYGGVACDMTAIASLCDGGGWSLVEDAAHGLFGRFEGRPLGRFGALGAFSFHHTKNISCHEGGALVVNDAGMLDAVSVMLDKGTNRVAFDQGAVGSYEWSGIGSSWRLAEPLIQVLADQLDQRERIQARRHGVWSAYARGLAGWADRTGAHLPFVPENADHPAHLFWLLLPPHIGRSLFVEHCADRGVQVARHFGSLPDSAFGRTIADPDDRSPVATRFGEQLVRLPLHPSLTDDDVDRVLEVVTSTGAGFA